MTGDYLPFTYFDKTKAAFRGFDVDMAEALGKALGVKVEYVQTAWPKLMADFEADSFDCRDGGRVDHARPAEKKGMFLLADHARRQRRRSPAVRTRTNSRPSPRSTSPARE